MSASSLSASSATPRRPPWRVDHTTSMCAARRAISQERRRQAAQGVGGTGAAGGTEGTDGAVGTNGTGGIGGAAGTGGIGGRDGVGGAPDRSCASGKGQCAPVGSGAAPRP